MKEFFEPFQGVDDTRLSNATRHDLHEMLMIGLLSILTGGRACADMEAFRCAWEPRLREFMKLGQKWAPIIGQCDKCTLPPLVRLRHAALGHVPLPTYTLSGVLRPRP